MSRRPRVPRTTTTTWSREVAIGGRPIEAVCAALLEMPARRGEVWDTGISHDDGCPALRHRRLDACDCEIVEIHARRVA